MWRGSKHSRPRAVGTVAAITWLFAVTVIYFWAHKPFDYAIVLGLGRTCLNIAVWLTIIWLATALGLVVGARVLAGLPAAVGLAFAAGLGLGAISVGMLCLGLVGLMTRPIAWGGIILGGLVLRRQMLDVLAKVRRVRLPRPENWFQWCILTYSCASLAMTFITALTPPTGWDALVYHLTGPRLFVEAGRIIHSVDLPYLGFPQSIEMQFTLGLLLVGEGIAPLLHFGYGVLALILVVWLAKQSVGTSTAWLAAGTFLSVPTLLLLMTRAYVDAALLYYSTAAFCSLVLWQQALKREASEQGWRWIWVMGLYCGMGGAVKYTAVGVCLAIGLIVTIISWSGGLGTVTRRVGWLAFAAALVVLPGLAENWLTTGNPVYPFFSSFGLYWDEWRRWWYGRPGTGLMATAPLRLATALLEATVLGTEGTNSYAATIGPVVVPGACLLFVVWRFLKAKERALIKYMVVFFVINYVIWLIGLAQSALLLQTRLLLPVFGVLSVMSGVAWERLSYLNWLDLRIGWIARIVLVFVLGLELFAGFTGFVALNPLPTVIGVESRSEYLARRLGWYYVAVDEMNHNLASDSKVLFLWEPRSYHCQVRCEPDALLDRWLHTTYRYGYDADAIASVWHSEGFTHVFLFKTGLDYILESHFDPVSADDLRVLNELLEQHTVRIREWGDAYSLFELTE